MKGYTIPHLSFIITGAIGTLGASNMFGELIGGLFIILAGGVMGHCFYLKLNEDTSSQEEVTQ